MKDYVSKLQPLLEKAGCAYVSRDYDTLYMEGKGGPMTVIVGCKGASKDQGVAFFNSPEYQELVELRAPYTSWQFRLVQAKF